MRWTKKPQKGYNELASINESPRLGPDEKANKNLRGCRGEATVEETGNADSFNKLAGNSDELESLIVDDMVELVEVTQKKQQPRRRKNPVVRNRAFPEPLDQKSLFYAAAIIFAGVIGIAFIGISVITFTIVL
ncbi:unnamed protein product, partial [Mesorhabditis spiculigera]